MQETDESANEILITFGNDAIFQYFLTVSYEQASVSSSSRDSPSEKATQYCYFDL